MTALQGGLLVAWAIAGTAVVAVREPIRQAALVGVMGLIGALTFFSLQAPDVALSMIVVGSIALPLMILLAAGRIGAESDDPEVSRGARHGVLLGGLALLAVTLVLGLRGLPDFGHFHGRYGQIVAYSAVTDRHAPNTVVVTAFDYRGFDTLGEEFILFTAAIGVALLLRSTRSDEEHEAAREVADSEEAETGAALRCLGTALVGPVVVLGVYVVSHGHLSPGGGFQGGVVLMPRRSCCRCWRAATGWRCGSAGRRPWRSPRPRAPSASRSSALGGLIAAGAWLENFLGKGPPGLLNSGGDDPPVEPAVGLEVAGALLVVAGELEDPRLLLRGGKAVSFLPYAVAAWLLLVGIYGVSTSRNYLHLVVCLMVAQSSTYVLLLSIGYLHGAKAPMFGDLNPRPSWPTRSSRR